MLPGLRKACAGGRREKGSLVSVRRGLARAVLALAIASDADRRCSGASPSARSLRGGRVFARPLAGRRPARGGGGGGPSIVLVVGRPVQRHRAPFPRVVIRTPRPRPRPLPPSE